MKRIRIIDDKGEGALSVWLRPVGDMVEDAEGNSPPHGSVLKGIIHVAGARLHLMALEVESVEGEQRAKHEANEEGLNDLYRFAEPGTPFETADIDGRKYVVYMTPFAD